MGLRGIEVEVGTDRVHGGSREDWKRRGEMRILEHGEQRGYGLQLTPHAGAGSVSALEKRLKT